MAEGGRALTWNMPVRIHVCLLHSSETLQDHKVQIQSFLKDKASHINDFRVTIPLNISKKCFFLELSLSYEHHNRAINTRTMEIPILRLSQCKYKKNVAQLTKEIFL